MGGCIGFLKTLRRLVDEQCPSSVYIAWEGGGSAKRRKLFPEYKLNRRPEKLNRFYGDDIPDTDDNRMHQMVTLITMLKNVPVCQLYVSDCEGDDVVAYLCRAKFRNVDKVIASSDKDMYQLLDDNTKIYNLHKKTYVLNEHVLKDFRVTAKNFAIAKALCGDPSDNIPGVKGMGFKTAVKTFPMLGTEDDILLQDVFDYAAAHRDESKSCQRVLDEIDNVRRNWKLVYLDGGMLSNDQAEKIDYVMEGFKPKISQSNLIKQLVAEGIGDFDVDQFFFPFRCITGLTSG
jgi:DNA polymerase-1